MAFIYALEFILSAVAVILLICFLISWFNFNFQNMPDDYVKLSHKRFRELYSEYKDNFYFDAEFFSARLRFRVATESRSYRIKLNIIDYLYLQCEASKKESERQRKEHNEAQDLMNKEIAYDHQVKYLTDPARVRKELDENGFTELNYTNRRFNDPKAVNPQYYDLKANDVIYEIKSDNFEITSFKLYVVIETSMGGCSMIPIERYALLKKEKENNTNNNE